MDSKDAKGVYIDSADFEPPGMSRTTDQRSCEPKD